MKDFRELSAEVKALEKTALSRQEVTIPPDKGVQFRLREGLAGGITFAGMLAEAKRLEKILAATKGLKEIGGIKEGK
ncbi:Uncharacterised protein [uncultured archaeon]|nr:Uncharacterised protein [uncultured archaeon]